MTAKNKNYISLDLKGQAIYPTLMTMVSQQLTYFPKFARHLTEWFTIPYEQQVPQDEEPLVPPVFIG